MIRCGLTEKHIRQPAVATPSRNHFFHIVAHVKTGQDSNGRVQVRVVVGPVRAKTEQVRGAPHIERLACLQHAHCQGDHRRILPTGHDRGTRHQARLRSCLLTQPANDLVRRV